MKKFLILTALGLLKSMTVKIANEPLRQFAVKVIMDAEELVKIVFSDDLTNQFTAQKVYEANRGIVDQK
jgi:hypothetical protein